jgi:VWFA-related protein
MRVPVLVAAAAVLAVAQPQNQNAELKEVRIRSAIYAPPPALTIAAQSNLVQVAATVRDRKGQAAGGFKADDIEILDNGVRQDITAFAEILVAQPASELESSPARGAVRPRYLALFFDDAHTGLAGLERTRRAAQKLIETGLQPGDQLGIFTDSGNVTVDFTSNKAELLAGLSRLRARALSGAPTGMCPPLSPLDAYVIARNIDLKIKQWAVGAAIACYCPPPQATGKFDTVDPTYQACVSAQDGFVQNMAENMWDQIRPRSEATIESITLVIRHLARTPGDRMLILVSSGFLAGSLDQIANALVDTAIRSHVVINALHAEGLLPDRNAPLRTEIYTQPLASLANGTGGRLIRNTNDFLNGMRTLAAPPAISYLLGFSPPGDPDDAFHTLKLRIRSRGGYQVESRPGYYYDAVRKAETIQQRIDREAAGDGTLLDFPAAIRVSPAPGKIRIDVQVDVRDFKFVEQAGRSLQQLTFVTVLRDSSGNYVTGRQAVMDLAATPAKLVEFRVGGIRTHVSLDAPPGSYQVRQIVREAGQNRFAASTTPIQIR